MGWYADVVTDVTVLGAVTATADRLDNSDFGLTGVQALSTWDYFRGSVLGRKLIKS